MSTTLAHQSILPATQPDIGYEPDFKKYQARSNRRQETESLSKVLPQHFPHKLNSPLVWDGDCPPSVDDYVYYLTATDLCEIKTALSHFQSLSKPLSEISRDTFPLPKLHATLRKISHDIHNGCGFKVVSGLPVASYTRLENIIIYVGISAHVAPVIGRQDNIYQGKPADVLLLHIKDLTKVAEGHQITAPTFTSEKQVFHTDSGDIVALFALEVATKGGESKLASSWRIYNELAATRPDLITTLADPWPVDDFGKTPQGYHLRSLLYHQPAGSQTPERIAIQYARRVFTGWQTRSRSGNIPPITEAQAEALDTLHFLAEKHCISLEFRPGDIQFLNNFSVLHAREKYQDTDTQNGELRRHLLRMWLRDPELAWATPDDRKQGWRRVYNDIDRHKVIFPLNPFTREFSVEEVMH